MRRHSIDDGNWSLRHEFQVAGCQLKLKARSVNRLEKPWAKRAMHLDRGAEDLVGDVIETRNIDRHSAGSCKCRAGGNDGVFVRSV
jgi:hypothetical protein